MSFQMGNAVRQEERQNQLAAGRMRSQLRDLESHSLREDHESGQAGLLLKETRSMQNSSQQLDERIAGHQEAANNPGLEGMESGSKTPLTAKERIDLIRAELESIRASTNQRKWETLNFEMQDLRDELSDEIHSGLKDAANLMGDLGKRLCSLEQKVEELTKAFSKISEASAEAATNSGKGGDR
jgi:hypothetical protein